MKWADGKAMSLGVWFRTDQNEGMKINYEDKVHKVEDILNNWQNKRLTLLGKITIIKALAASQLVYVMSSLRTCFKSLKEINDLIFKFLWDGKRDKIKRSEMIADCGDGGQKILDIMTFNKSLKIAWIVKYISDDCKSKWKTFWDSYLSKWGGKLVFLGSLGKKDADDFLQELIEIWADFNFRDSFLSKHDFCSSMIWNNSLVRIANRPFFYKHWAEAGVQNIKDLVNDDFTVITYRDFREKYCSSASFLKFYGVTSAIRSAMKSLKLKTQEGKDQGFSVQKLIAATKPTKLAYKVLIKKISTSPQKSQEKWIQDCNLEVVEDLSWVGFIYYQGCVRCSVLR